MAVNTIWQNVSADIRFSFACLSLQCSGFSGRPKTNQEIKSPLVYGLNVARKNGEDRLVQTW